MTNTVSEYDTKIWATPFIAFTDPEIEPLAAVPCAEANEIPYRIAHVADRPSGRST